MNIQIHPHDGAPVYRQIQQQIALAIADRQLHPGQTLTAEEVLAAQLVISPTAVRKAYEELVAAGLCDHRLDGTFRIADPGLGSCDGGSTLAMAFLGRELLGRELETARDFQRRLMPAPEIRTIAWTTCYRSYAAGALSGDFCDVLQQADGTVDLVVADVAGKGLASGLIMAVAKSLLPVAATEACPGEALGWLNRTLYPILTGREFVAMAWIRLEPRSGHVTLANAGLPDPFLLRLSGPIEPLAAQGNRLPVAARCDSRYSTAAFRLAAGDRLLLFTDGIPESTDSEGRLLGYEELSAYLHTRGGAAADTTMESPGDWLDRFLAGISRRTGSILADDWTALLLDYHPNGGETPCNS